MSALTVGSLFSGIGGLDLGLERAGMRVVWQVELDDYCNKVLAKHWPDVARFRDVRTVGRAALSPVDVLCGGFPCQDISNAGQRAGIDGPRSGLWAEFARLVGELRPRYVLVENVAALLGRGMARVCGDLAALGYDAEWGIVPAAAVGAPHLRNRVWIIAYASRKYGALRRNTQQGGEAFSGRTFRRLAAGAGSRRTWDPEPRICRVADGVPARVDRLRGLGNAVVPQVAEYVGRCIVAHAGGAT